MTAFIATFASLVGLGWVLYSIACEYEPPASRTVSRCDVETWTPCFYDWAAEEVS